MQIRQGLMDKSKYSIKSPYKMTPKGVCVHNTANDASAKNEIAYMKRNNNQTSFHIAVDDTEAIQAIPFNRSAWHAGDGKNGKGNRNYIAIEICYSKSGGDRFIKAEQNAAKVIAQICKQYGFSISNVKKHQDFSSKYCPHRTLDLGWDRFLKMVQAELGRNSLNDDTTYKIKNGDTLYSIAKKHGTTVADLKALNNIQDVNVVYVGDVLKIPVTGSTVANRPKLSKQDKPAGVIATIQQTLNDRYGFNIVVDDIYGSETKKALIKGYQTELNKQFGENLVVDGIWGSKTKNASVTVRKGAKGNLTWILQAILHCLGYNLGAIDGIFGDKTEQAVRAFQRANKLSVDGIPGKNTFAKLFV